MGGVLSDTPLAKSPMNRLNAKIEKKLNLHKKGLSVVAKPHTPDYSSTPAPTPDYAPQKDYGEDRARALRMSEGAKRRRNRRSPTIAGDTDTGERVG